MDFKNSKTKKNLETAFAGECQARVKYEYFSSKAKKDGFEQIAEIFNESSSNEKEHAKLWYKALHENSIADTYANLLDAAAGEHGEWTDMYEKMAREAKEEGFDKLAYLFSGVAAIEKTHEERFLRLASEVKEGKFFKKEKISNWKCRNCGHIHSGKEAPKVCPVCEHPQAFFEVL